MFRSAVLGVLVMVVGYAAGAAAGGQQPWPVVGKKQIARAPSVRSRAEPIVSPRAQIGGGANGVYCTAPCENGITVHDLGFLPTGRNVIVTVEGISDGFNPVAGIVVPQIGQPAGNTIKTTTSTTMIRAGMAIRGLSS